MERTRSSVGEVVTSTQDTHVSKPLPEPPEDATNPDDAERELSDGVEAWLEHLAGC